MMPILLSWPFPLYAYPLFLGFAWGIAYTYSLVVAQEMGIDAFKFKIYSLGLFASTWIGAKIFFWIFSAEINATVIKSINFWMGGGFVFFGGLVFGTIFTMVHNHYFKLINVEMAARLLPGLCLGHAVGRVGCFLAGCCFGRKLDTPLRIFEHELDKHPVQFYEIFVLVALFFYLRTVLKKSGAPKMQIILTYFMAYAGFRFFIEFMRADTIRGVYGPFSSSQWVSLVIVLVSTVLFVQNRYWRASKLV
ncbi:MAG: hypothetical protein A2X86_04720 [Bdellovibrionales bacterium GWA2_49_15]|nr:MAG: hypothetical protein A2X86_04720 [Bdellovibrionales bacterium GWA2_49_15]